MIKSPQRFLKSCLVRARAFRCTNDPAFKLSRLSNATFLPCLPLFFFFHFRFGFRCRFLLRFLFRFRFACAPLSLALLLPLALFVPPTLRFLFRLRFAFPCASSSAFLLRFSLSLSLSPPLLAQAKHSWILLVFLLAWAMEQVAWVHTGAEHLACYQAFDAREMGSLMSAVLAAAVVIALVFGERRRYGVY